MTQVCGYENDNLGGKCTGIWQEVTFWELFPLIYQHWAFPLPIMLRTREWANMRLINMVQLNKTALLAPIMTLPIKFCFFFVIYTGGKKNKCDSYLTLERLQSAAAELQNFADRVKQGRKHNLVFQTTCALLKGLTNFDYMKVVMSRNNIIKSIYSTAQTSIIKRTLGEKSWPCVWLWLPNCVWMIISGCQGIIHSVPTVRNMV